jgi:hypothetical protein
LPVLPISCPAQPLLVLACCTLLTLTMLRPGPQPEARHQPRAGCLVLPDRPWYNGVAVLDGNLVFRRSATQAPDGPFDALKIALNVQDDDGVADAACNVLVERLPCSPDCVATADCTTMVAAGQTLETGDEDLPLYFAAPGKEGALLMEYWL